MENKEQFIEKYIYPFDETTYIYESLKGFIVWRMGTGNNTELLHIKTDVKGKGYGRSLFYRMLNQLEESPPYYSVFGFTRVGNKEAQAFYGALGFHLRAVEGLYKDGTAVMFWQSYEMLVERMREFQA